MRRRKAEKRESMPDPKYRSKLLGKFMNMVMERGKKSVAEHIVYGALDTLREQVKDKEPLEVLEVAIENVRPLVEVKSRRIGGATYQVPVEVKQERGQFMAMRWIRDFARNQKGKPMKVKLAVELLNAYKKEGPAIKKKEDTHRMAEANKAFAHYKW
ncbi:MAG: 30S ribosomal protein S7 [Candidatus Omnitrophica bacterium]|nr:30S ribosomal protein S7 [Candidatus Omnitrophota bacterium]MBU1128871.1 30S ribosomal protein S7 [Candidatus Omnitrophota bacterium]MBU1656958.1 30S ribosomal protein S7 [Candidatus Omnitrophota bacterium]MBU1785076.1 30S ribosomal protein S7 [Candidatus Omnitrophota bacterium]MBU1851117.1 30S ribosomal protein S7 [Candidatus Omnitrophota bacterium]